MNLTTNLKGWLAENCQVPATASDEEFKKAASLAIFDDKLSATKLAELTEEGGPDAADVIGQALAKALAPITQKMASLEERQSQLQNAGALGSALESAITNVKPTVSGEPDKVPSSTRAAQLFGAADPQVRVKSPMERYSHTKSMLTYPDRDKHGRPHPKAGLPISMPNAFNSSFETIAQDETAIIGAFVKWSANMGGKGVCPHPLLRMTEHDQQLMEYAMHEMPWTGYLNASGRNEIELTGEKLTDFQRKTLLDDSTSGGLEAVPVVVDLALITTPVLFGELFPLVEVVPIPRGRRIEGASIGNISWTSGTAEGTSITPFNTASMIAAFDNTVYPVVAAIEVGNDFQEDSPFSIGQTIISKAGEKHMEWLDNQIANGDGTTEPQGIFNASGTTDIGNPSGGAGAAATITDYENLLFGISKAYRNTPQDRARTVYIANDTSYKRARAIYVGAADARRLFGTDYQSYMLGDVPFKVQNDIDNAYAACCNLRYYRMYRRQGVQVVTETGGRTLQLQNLTLIVMRARWAGKLTLGGACAYSDNWQA